jgi:DnaJ-class molecular chaperone
LKDTIAVKVRTKSENGKTVSHFADAVPCERCQRSGYVESKVIPGTVEACTACKGRGLTMLKADPLPQIQDW